MQVSGIVYTCSAGKMTQTQPAAPPSVNEAPTQDALWTRGFVLLCLTTMLCYVCHQLVVVVLPLYVDSLGGNPVIAGLVFSSFSVLSFILRPLMGHLTDRWSVRGMLLVGTGILGALGACFAVPSIWAAFFANAIRGIGWGCFSTANSTAVAHLAPPARRGEASGWSGTAVTASASFAPALGLALLSSTGDFTLIFMLAGLAGLGASIAVVCMPSIGTGTASFREAMTLRREDFTVGAFIDRPVLMASALLVCVTMSGPITSAFVPLHAKSVGVENIGLYFIASGIFSILARLVFGPFIDRQSRGFWIVLGFCLLMGAFAVFATARSIEVFILAAVFNALGHATAGPALTALAMDRAERNRMGRAMATFSMFYRVGEGVGAPLAGALLMIFGYPGMYIGAICYLSVGVVVAALNWGVIGKPILKVAPSH
jgi:MFS family permease